MWIYLCGPTVYSEVHIGNVRPILTFDLVIRAFRFLKQDVQFIHNITDIDDKIIAKAKSENSTEINIADKYTKLYLETLTTLNIEKPNYLPTVMNAMPGIIDFINRLVKLNFAYEVKGNVFFNTAKVKTYGCVSNQDYQKLVASEIYESNQKQNHQDFALWKNTGEGITFDSPWGLGRPGWHTECAFFVDQYLQGQPLDIHGGGIDLIFPHHENENAQYQALYQNPIAKKWRHIGHLKIDNKKMSKSEGQIILVSDFVKNYGPDILRMIFLNSSYSAPLNISDELILNAIKITKKFEKSFLQAQFFGDNLQVSTKKIVEIATEISQFNFAKASKIIHEIFTDFNRLPNSENAAEVISTTKLLGFVFSKKTVSKNDKIKYHKWLQLRSENRFEEADFLRRELIVSGLI